MKTTALGLSLLLAAPAFAHGSTKPMHGGVTTVSGENVFELVNQPGAVAVYVNDDGDPVDAAKMTGTMTVTSAGKTSTIALQPAAGNRFDAPGARLTAGSKVGITLIDQTTQAHVGTVFAIR